MAATIATATGYDSSRVKTAHRLGSERAHAMAATWHTFARAYMNRDGSGRVSVERNGRTIHEWTFGPESETTE